MKQKTIEKLIWSGIWLGAIFIFVAHICVLWSGTEENDIHWGFISVIFVLMGIVGYFASYKVKGKFHGLVFFILCVAFSIVFGMEQLRALLPELEIGKSQPSLIIMIVLFSEGTAYTLAKYTYKCKALNMSAKWYKYWDVEIGSICGILGSVLLWILLEDFEFSLTFFTLGVFLGVYGFHYGREARKHIT